MIHFQAIQFVSWLIKLFIFQQVSQYKFRYKTLLLVPLVIALIDYVLKVLCRLVILLLELGTPSLFL